MQHAVDGRVTVRAFVVAAAVVAAGLAAAAGLATARQQQQQQAPFVRTATSLDAPTLATKAHGRAKPWTTAPRTRVP